VQLEEETEGFVMEEHGEEGVSLEEVVESHLEL